MVSWLNIISILVLNWQNHPGYLVNPTRKHHLQTIFVSFVPAQPLIVQLFRDYISGSVTMLSHRSLRHGCYHVKRGSQQIESLHEIPRQLFSARLFSNTRVYFSSDSYLYYIMITPINIVTIFMYYQSVLVKIKPLELL